MAMSNREYYIALQWVQRKYNLLFHYATQIVLTPAHLFPAGEEGLCSPDNYVSVSDGLRTVGEYVDVLVHELTHCRQNILDVKWSNLKREEEAYQAGIQAAVEYDREAAPWMQRGTRTLKEETFATGP